MENPLERKYAQPVCANCNRVKHAVSTLSNVVDEQKRERKRERVAQLILPNNQLSVCNNARRASSCDYEVTEM